MVPISTQSEHSSSSSSIEGFRVTISNQLPLAADMLDCETTMHGLRVLSANGMHRGLPVYCCTVPAMQVLHGHLCIRRHTGTSFKYKYDLSTPNICQLFNASHEHFEV